MKSSAKGGSVKRGADAELHKELQDISATSKGIASTLSTNSSRRAADDVIDALKGELTAPNLDDSERAALEADLMKAKKKRLELLKMQLGF